MNNSYPKLFYILKEINLFDKTNLVDELNSILKQKNVTKPEIIDYFKKPYLKWFVSPTDDNEKEHYVTKHNMSSGDPEWAKNTFDFNTFSNEHKEELAHTIDFFNQLNERDLKKIHKIPFPTVRQLVKKWDEELAKRMDSSIHHFKVGKDVEILKQWPNGYKIVKILSDEARREEGNLMGHCVGGDYYRDETILSLRDEHGMPHVTMELNKDNNIVQIKGKQNAAPVDKYVPYIKEFIRESDLEIDRDGGNIGFTRWDNKYYDPDSDKWKAVYRDKIIPSQQKSFISYKKFIKNNVMTIPDGTVNLEYLYIEELPEFLKDITIEGSFLVQSNKLKSLKNFPRIVTGVCNIGNNELVSLDGSLRQVGHTLRISSNKLTTLNNPGIRVRDLITFQNPLVTLEGLDKFIILSLFKHGNSDALQSLKGCPKKINYNFEVMWTPITSLEGGPRIAQASYYAFRNKLTSLKGCPTRVNGTFDVELNYLTSLDYIPKYIGKDFACLQQETSPNPNMHSMTTYLNITRSEIKSRMDYFGGDLT